MKHTLYTAAAATLLACTLHQPAHSQTGRREVGNLVMEGIPEQIPARITEKLDQYNNTRGAGLADWAPGGEGMIIRTRFGDVSQFHFVRQPGAYREQLTFYKEPVSGGQRNPNPAERTFLFSKDVGGGENYQVFLFNTDSRQVTQSHRWQVAECGAHVEPPR